MEEHFFPSYLSYTHYIDVSSQIWIAILRGLAVKFCQQGMAKQENKNERKKDSSPRERQTAWFLFICACQYLDGFTEIPLEVPRSQICSFSSVHFCDSICKIIVKLYPFRPAGPVIPMDPDESG